MKAGTIRIHHFEPVSQVNGPGKRLVVWVQGCALGCTGCFNPETHDFLGGETWEVEKLAQHIIRLQDGLEGLTISGGEPAHQHRALAQLIRQIRVSTKLSVLVFSGYDMDELKRLPKINEFLEGIDVLIAGRYVANQRVARNLIGSGNKKLYFFTNRYTIKDMEEIPQAEILISADGEVILSGIDPLHWNSLDRKI